MSATKKIYGNYTLQTVGASDTVNINSSAVTITGTTVTVNGNLVVTGVQSTIQSVNTGIYDNLITLNSGLWANTAPTLNAGIEVNRGSSPATALRWNEAGSAWEFTNDGTTYAAIGTGTGFSGNIDLGTYNIYSSSTPTLKINDNVAILTTTVAPTTVTGYNVLYSQTPGSGGSGLYVTNTTNQNQELVTKTKAIVYALIM